VKRNLAPPAADVIIVIATVIAVRVVLAAVAVLRHEAKHHVDAEES